MTYIYTDRNILQEYTNNPEWLPLSKSVEICHGSAFPYSHGNLCPSYVHKGNRKEFGRRCWRKKKYPNQFNSYHYESVTATQQWVRLICSLSIQFCSGIRISLDHLKSISAATWRLAHRNIPTCRRAALSLKAFFRCLTGESSAVIQWLQLFFFQMWVCHKCLKMQQ